MNHPTHHSAEPAQVDMHITSYFITLSIIA